MAVQTVQFGKNFPFLPIPEHDFSLHPQRIDIWQYPLSTLWPEAESRLDEAELQRAKRFHFARHQRRFTIARAGLRLILSRYLMQNPQDIEFLVNPYGKPYVEHASQIQFNLSHSQDLAILAIGQQHPVGIDIEFFSSRPFAGMSNMMFSPQEIEAYIKLPISLRSLAFFHVWAQKEAFIKACGMGLSYPTQSFTVPVHFPSHQEVHDARHAITWQIRSFMPKIACYAALCNHPSIQTIRYHALDDNFHALK
jgi:4'-phosphopantetheinyl transferase